MTQASTIDLVTVALTAEHVAATALVDGGTVVHLTAFPAGELR